MNRLNEVARRRAAWPAALALAALSCMLYGWMPAPHACAQPRDGDGEDADTCMHAHSPEPLREFLGLRQQFLAQRAGGHGSLRAALAQRDALKSAQEKIANAGGDWSVYGTPKLIVNDPRYGSVNGDGYVYNSGRIDSFDYDAAGKRLFASLGTGGIWMSADKGQHWTSVGDALPSQSVGSVAWSAAGGGTIVVAGGDPSFGGDDYAGIGAFWSNDLGQSWHIADGVPEGILGFKAAVDHAHPDIVYLGTSKGLFRSTDAGRSYVNVALPTSADCAGVTDIGSKCQYANYVTDVIVKEPGGTTNEAGGQVLAGVGYRAGQLALSDGTISAPGNGLYYSGSGAPGSFSKLSNSAANSLSPLGFTVQERIGRIAFGEALGDAQDHNYVYAMVQDAVLFNHGFPLLDLPEGLGTAITGALPVGLSSTLFNGLYVSADFGQTWTRAADTEEIANTPTSALAATGAATNYAPGVQGYYNLWVKPDPTAQLSGVPTRLAFGLEEVFSNLVNDPQNGTLQVGPSDYQVVGAYRTSTAPGTILTGGTTTHPDQHAAVWIPDDDGSGGVTLVVGNDGGAYSQHIGATGGLQQSGWGDGIQDGFNTLLPYSVAVAKDGVAWFGLQDNGSGKVDTDGKYYENYGGDGFYVAVDPDDSNTAWEEYTMADMRYTTDGGQSWTSNAPSLTGANFANFFMMDPTDATHMMTAAKEVMEMTAGPSGSWTQVFDLGTSSNAGGANNIMSALDLQGDNAYVGFCGVCDILNNQAAGFHNGIATNVNGDKPPQRGTSDGWHFAAAGGLPNRYISGVEIDPADPRTVYVTLGGYANRGWEPPGSYLDANPDIGSGHVFVSHDAGEHFSDISGNLPDVHATAILLRQGQLIVGTDIGAFISSDVGGSSWAPLGNALPAMPILQFQLMPGDDSKLVAATFGRAIWTYTFGAGGAAAAPAANAAAARSRFGGALGAPLLAVLLLGGLWRRRAHRWN
ncbi:MAG TPA: hypothetical protein VHE37_14280 [Nevskiaceae bacterium]|nr:hypothetical protein [Nevskiaceae bacterium]